MAEEVKKSLKEKLQEAAGKVVDKSKEIYEKAKDRTEDVV